MNPTKAKGLVLAVHPTSSGFGWAVFEGPNALIHWSAASTKGKNPSGKAMARFIDLVERYHPSALVLEAFSPDDSRRGPRLRELAETMSGLARDRDMAVSVFDRATVARSVQGDAAASRHEVAQAVANRFEFLRERLPAKRKVWEPEIGRQRIFDAVALGLTYYAS